MREKTSFFPWLCCALIWLAPMACKPEHEPFDRPPPPLLGLPGLENCGYQLAPETHGELDPCADGQTVLQERTSNTWVFEDPTAVYAFELPEAGQVCIRVQNGEADGSHRPWWGKVELDGRTVFGRNQLHQGVAGLRQTLEIEAGPHELAVTLYGPRRSFVDIAVGFAPQQSASGYRRTSRNGTMTIEALHMDPLPAYQGSPMTFSVDATVSWAAVLGLPCPPFANKSLRATFQLADSDCRQILSFQTLSEIVTGQAGPVRLEWHWDGRGPSGEWLEPGTYYARAVVDLVTGSRRGTVLLDRALTLVHVLVLEPETDPPEIRIVSPGDGAEIQTDMPEIRIAYQDAESGVDPSSLSVWLNGEPVTGRFDVGPAEAVWQVGLDAYLWEGASELSARVTDRAGNEAEASATFEVHTSTEQLVAALDDENPLERQRAAAKLVYRDSEIDAEVLHRSLVQLCDTPEPRAVDGLLSLGVPGHGDMLTRMLAVSVIGQTARHDPQTASRQDVVDGLGSSLLDDRAIGVKVLSARALGLTQNQAGLVPLDEFLEHGVRVPAMPESCEGFDKQQCDECAAHVLITGFQVIKSAIRIGGHEHVVGNPGEILDIWRSYRRQAEQILEGGQPDYSSLPGGAP